jgi:phosphoribosyl-AMP cyclohydrolase|tara:strand:- start:1051 stop:1443 length:393 start_codon:yes stop_codon:yes gene_type:complete
MNNLIENANFRVRKSGEDLVIAIVQDFKSGEILMVAFMNREALILTLKTGKMHYFSTSRSKLWLKGETSGHNQIVKEARIDCDGDALLFKVDQVGASCHKGYNSCFFRRFEKEKLTIFKERVFDPKKVYK